MPGVQELVEGGYSKDMLVDVGMPVIHRGASLAGQAVWQQASWAGS